MPHQTATDDMPDLNGRVIDSGRLKLLESLGSGAYGKVYRALDITSPRDQQVFFAVKCLLRPVPGSDKEEFQNREFTIHKHVCNHPNIVTLHRVIYDRDFVYVVLDLCTGGDLFAAITETDMFHNNVQLVKDFFIQLIDAVQYCHEKSVFHRDLKPENVLCTEDGSGIRLADFGLSTRNHVSKDFGCGSSYYMSPVIIAECIGRELSVGRYSTRHSDVWSLGVILTNMISGRNPWRYATAKDECFAAYLHDRDFLRQVLPISPGANAILKRIFNINPLCRISLIELRQEILALDTFFLVEEDVGRVPAQAPSEAFDDSSRIFTNRKTVAASSNDSDTSVSSDEVYAFNSPRDDHAQHPDSPDVSIIHSIASVTPPSSTRASGGSSSGSDSEGPITPATYPVDPAIEVPDLPEGEGLDQSTVFSASSEANTATAHQSPVKQKRRHLLRRALGRIMDLPSGSLPS